MKCFSTSFLSPTSYYSEKYKNENNFFENSIYYFSFHKTELSGFSAVKY
ncbi:hypothetical protein BCBMB205_09410 [Bacillus sp. CN2]|nr:hypothetical protein BCBMB205_09410 [Bacillus velezensis]ARZ57271.1 hypothetical protein BAGQ_1036 [Bacillus velezensis]RAP21409.1 hypothetical protein C2W63_00101 [Bacillus velezensis]GFR54266.1 hypothetical protein BCBMB205_09410 [Bacillus sp. CN2]